MKVLLIDVNCKNSSTGNIVYNLYRYINSSGDEAAVCYGRGDKIAEKNIFKFGIDIETYLHAFLTRITGFTGCFSFFSTRRLIKFIKKFQPDVVHIHELHAYFVNIKPLLNFLKKNHIKTVMTLHCEFAYTGKCGHAVECEQWKNECKKCPHLKEYVSTMWFDHTNYMFNQKKELYEDFEKLVVVTPSEWLEARAKQSILKNKKIYTIHNGVDAKIFNNRDTKLLRNKLGILPDEKVVLTVAPHILSEEKGGKYFLQIAKELECENVKFIMIGVDDVKEVHKKNVIQYGIMNDKDLLAMYYSLADVFVLCSKKETFSMTCAEALLCGTPIVGFECGAPEMVFPKECASFVEYGNIEQLKRNIINFLNWKSLNIQVDAYEFSIQIMCEKYMELYKEHSC